MNKVTPGSFTWNKTAAQKAVGRILPLAKSLVKGKQRGALMLGEEAAFAPGKALANAKPKAPVIPGPGHAAVANASKETRSGLQMPTLKPATPAAPAPSGLKMAPPTTAGGTPAPIVPQQPPGLLQPRPTVLPPNPASTFDPSTLGQFNPLSKVAALSRLSPLARIIGNMPARNFRF